MSTRLRTALWAVGVLLCVALLVVLPLTTDVQADAERVLRFTAALAGFVALLGAALGLGLLLFWALRRERGTTVSPFEVSPELGLIGSALAGTLVADLQRIAAVHAVKVDPVQETGRLGGLSTERIALPSMQPAQEELETLVKSLGTISVGALELSLGGLLLSLKLLRRDPDALVLSGSAQRDGDRIQVVTRVESGRGARAFATTRTAGEVAAALDELAYRIVAEAQIVDPPVRTASWQSLRAFTDALTAYITFSARGRIEDLDAALASCEAALGADRQYTNISTVAYNVGIAYLHVNDCDKALRSFELARESNPSDAAPLIGLGMTYHRLGRYDRAIERFDQALALAPADDLRSRAAAAGGKGSALADQGNVLGAIECFTLAAQLSERAGDPLGQAHNLSRLAMRHSDRGETAEAVAGARQAAEAAARLPDTDPAAKALLLDNVAGVLVDAREHVEAQARASEALRCAAEVPGPVMRAKIQLTLARSYLDAGDLDKAYVAALAAAEPAGTVFRHSALAIVGVVALRKGEVEAAAAAFREVIAVADAMLENEPRNYGALYAKALALDGRARLATGAQAQELRAEAAQTRHRAKLANPATGVATRQQRFVDALDRPSG